MKKLSKIALSENINATAKQLAFNACKLACLDTTTTPYMKSKFNAFKYAMKKGEFFNLYTTIAYSEVASFLRREYHEKGVLHTAKSLDAVCYAVKVIESKIQFVEVVTLCQPYSGRK